MITPDGHTLIVGETAKSQFTAFAIDVNTGLLSDQRVWASLPGVNPDGCCMDAAGCMWVASPTGHGINSEEAEVSKFIRFAQGGQVLEETPSRLRSRQTVFYYSTMIVHPID